MTEVAQSFSGTVSVAVEPTPFLMSVEFATDTYYRYVFYLAEGGVATQPDGTTIIGTGVPVDGQVVDPIYDPPTLSAMGIYNRGDEAIDIEAKLICDGVFLIDSGRSGLQPGQMHIPDGSVPLLSAGSHILRWIVNARMAGTSDAYTSYYDDTVTFAAYTAELTAIATSVAITQTGTDKPWLTGSASGFSAIPVRVEPNLPITLKFELSNQGDEPVRMYVGYDSGGGVYESGVLIGDMPLAMAADYIDLVPGSSNTFETVPYTPVKSFTVAFAVLRERKIG